VFVDWLGGTFLEAYRDEMGDSPLLPNPANFRDVLEVHLLEKAIYELVYELNNRPRWASIPLRGILEIAALKTK
jgi:maltose alpha-D-glucosyltransferase/alpha-amylase